MRKATIWVLSVLAGVALFLAIVLTCFEGVAFNETRYFKAQARYGLEAVTGMNQDDLRRVTHELLLYCRGQRDTLDMTATINGQVREVFDQREKDHMVDVQRLFIKGYHLRAIAVASFLFLVLVLLAYIRGGVTRALARGWIATIIVFGVLFAVFGVYMAIDFDRAFLQFHMMFFSNDFWILDPSYEVLIQMLPEDFFMSIANGVVLWAAACLVAVTAGAAGVLIHARRRAKRVAAA